MRNANLTRRSGTRVGTFVPGEKLGVHNMNEVQDWNDNVLLRQSFSQLTVVGPNTIDIKLQGLAKMFIGILILDSGLALDNFVTLTINTHVVIQKVPWTALANAPAVSNYTGMFYPVGSLLNGPNDTITVDYVVTTTAGTVYITCYYN